MKRLYAALWLVFGLVCGCSSPCRGSSECSTGEHCDFERGVCIAGCAADADCGGRNRCDLALGRCLPLDPVTRPSPDMGITDTSSGADDALGTDSSTTGADAGPQNG